ncbi:hypothetical protein TNCV_4096841 [Trichonephila clavipes]|nr:hypothetical protein TNCV_4096841 [Trichonephila clavipes]
MNVRVPLHSHVLCHKLDLTMDAYKASDRLWAPLSPEPRAMRSLRGFFVLPPIAHNPANRTSINRTIKDDTKEEVPFVKAVAVYNDVMGGVDRFD